MAVWIIKTINGNGISLMFRQENKHTQTDRGIVLTVRVSVSGLDVCGCRGPMVTSLRRQSGRPRFDFPNPVSRGLSRFGLKCPLNTIRLLLTFCWLHPDHFDVGGGIPDTRSNAHTRHRFWKDLLRSHIAIHKSSLFSVLKGMKCSLRCFLSQQRKGWIAICGVNLPCDWLTDAS